MHASKVSSLASPCGPSRFVPNEHHLRNKQAAPYQFRTPDIKVVIRFYKKMGIRGKGAILLL